tara:strand:+ start:22444 stop:24177 length:1734 start_codon:yes stop_codon:yes gene_type:complete
MHNLFVEGEDGRIRPDASSVTGVVSLSGGRRIVRFSDGRLEIQLQDGTPQWTMDHWEGIVPDELMRDWSLAPANGPWPYLRYKTTTTTVTSPTGGAPQITLDNFYEVVFLVPGVDGAIEEGRSLWLPGGAQIDVLSGWEGAVVRFHDGVNERADLYDLTGHHMIDTRGLSVLDTASASPWRGQLVRFQGQLGRLDHFGYGEDLPNRPVALITASGFETISETGAVIEPLVTSEQELVGYTTFDPWLRLVGVGSDSTISNVELISNWLQNENVRLHRISISQSAGPYLVSGRQNGEAIVSKLHIVDGRVQEERLADCGPAPTTTVFVTHPTDTVSLNHYIHRPPPLAPTAPLSNVVFVDVHGGPSAHFGPVVSAYQARLLQLGATIYAVNYRGSAGFGRLVEGVDQPYWTVRDMVHDIDEVIAEASRANPDKAVILGGPSFGGYLALIANVFGNPEQRLDGVTVWASFSGYQGGFDALTAQGSAAQNFTIDIRRDQLTTQFDALMSGEEPITMRAPVYFVHGEQDTRAPLQLTRELANAMQLRGNQMIEFIAQPEMGHEDDPVAIENSVFRLLETISR